MRALSLTHAVFTNILPGGFLEALAGVDVLKRIKVVHEFYADYFVVSPSLFHFNSDSQRAARAIQENKQFSSRAAWSYDRDFQGLLSVMLSLKRRPDVRYMAGSDLAKKLAHDLVHTMLEEQDLFTFHAGEPTLLLVLDRREDVVTPLLTQWTYQAMVHELLGIHMNRINLAAKVGPKVDPATGQAEPAPAPGPKSPEEKSQDALRDVVLSSEQDDFFRSSMFVNFGELGIRVKKLVADFQNATKTQIKLESIGQQTHCSRAEQSRMSGGVRGESGTRLEAVNHTAATDGVLGVSRLCVSCFVFCPDDMQRFVDNYPQFALQSGTVSRHVSVMGEISKIVNQRKLLAVSALEQELVCGSEHQEVCDKLAKLIDDREVQFMDKLRCTMLYGLRYENHPNQLPILRGQLRAHARVAGLRENVLELLDRVLALSGGHSRTWPLFGDEAEGAANSIKNAVKTLATNVKGIDNIYTQHRSLMFDILTQLYQGELKTMQFPFAEGGSVKTYVFCSTINAHSRAQPDGQSVERVGMPADWICVLMFFFRTCFAFSVCALAM